MRKRLLTLGLVLAAFCSACSAPGGPNELPVTDDFSDCSRWATDEDELASLGCVDDAYRILIKDPRDMQTAIISLSTGAEGLSVEADAAYETGPEDAGYGVSCWASEEQGYLFLVSPDGTWAIVKWTDGRTPSVLAESETEDAIEGFSSAANRIRGECFGGGEEPAALALYVNDKKIATAEDGNGLASFREVGVNVWVFSGEAGTEVRVDNFLAEELEASGQRRGSGSEPAQETAPTTEAVPTVEPEPSADELCTQDGIRYAGTTEEGAEVCFTLTPDGGEWVEIGYAFVPASDCPKMATGTVYAEGPGPLSAPGRIRNSDFTATIRPARASGVLEDSDICPGKKFRWSARRQP